MKKSHRIVLPLLHQIDSLVGDTKRGKISHEELGKMMVSLYGDIVAARKSARGEFGGL